MTTPSEDVIEAMARAIGNAVTAKWRGDIQGFDSREAAQHALSALETAGFVLVPKDATEDVLFAMGQAADFHIPVGANRGVVWSAMIAAASAGKG